MVTNGSFLEGDHIFINANFLGRPGFVAPFNTSISVTGDELTAFILGQSVILDTYSLARNGSFAIEVSTIDSLEQEVTCTYEGVFLGNFFEPKVVVDIPVEVAEAVYNLTWSSSDNNADDTHFYDVWLSADSGVSYNLLAKNLTDVYHIWNSTGSLQPDEFIVRIRAYSVDLSLYSGPFLNIPEDYVPGDYGDGFYSFGHPNGIPFLHNIGVSSPPDVTITQGEVGNEIRWLLSFWGGYGIVGYELDYTIYQNGALMVSERLTISSELHQYITLSIDSLPPGIHNITLRFLSPGPDTDVVTDIVFVHVTSSTIPPTLVAIHFAVGIWFMASILAVVLLAMKKRR